jgi:amidase
MGTLGEQTRWLDATAQAELVRRGDVSPAELTAAAAERIEQSDAAIGAVNLRWFDRAIERAHTTPAGGPLHGVPFLLKDLWANYAGHPITNGNRALKDANYIPTANTWLVDRFERAGLSIMGRAASPEWGSVPVTEPLAFGVTRNPWNLAHSPGGSSGGSAAAVAAGMVPAAHASDGGGSIRIPASCCGLVGLKPSQGRITTGPLRDESGLGVELAVTRTVRDTALLLDIAHGPGIGDTVIAAPPLRPYVEEVGAHPGRLRIGLLDFHPDGHPVHEECVRAVRDTARLLESLGHHVEPAYPSVLDDQTLGRQFGSMWATNMSVHRTRTGDLIGRPLREDEVEPINWALAELARATTADAYAMALGAACSFRRRMQAWWSEDGWDLLLTPTMAQPPAPIGFLDSDPTNPLAGFAKAVGYVPFTPAANMSYQPAISLPVHWTPEGLPIGVHLVAAYAREDILIRVASQLEAIVNWAERRPY